MENGIDFSSVFGAPGVLDALFPAPPARSPSGARSRATVVLKPSLALRCRRHAEQAGFLPDTLFAAAWLLLQARWLGSQRPGFAELATGNAAAPSRRWLVSLDFDANCTAARWLVHVDASRRAAGEVRASEHGDSDPERRSVVLWAGVGADAGDGGAVLGFVPAMPDAGGGAADARLWLDASSDLLDTACAAVWLAALADSAEDLLDRPECALHQIRTLPHADEVRQRERWNVALQPVDASRTVHGMFARQVQSAPDAIALIDGDRQLSYAEVDRFAGLLAHRIEVFGVRAGDRVGLVLERSMLAVVAQLAVLKAGACYVPVPPDFPAERAGAMLEGAGVPLVLTTGALRNRVPAELSVLLLDDALHAAPEATIAPRRAATCDGTAAAYVMYTSGSSGVPKGVEVDHSAILRLVVDADYVEFALGRAVLHAAPLAFDASTFEIWGPLLNGGCCVIHDEAVPTGAGLARMVARHGVHTAWLTAALFNAVVDDDPMHLRGLVHLIVGGEALSVSHVRRALAALPKLALSNGYGPTECTTFAATHRIPRELPEDTRSIPLGRPIQGTVLRILSPTMALLPAGLAGQLCIGGPGLARGYLGQPRLTAERFVADPFGATGDRLYLTGDLARWLPDGTVEFLGRRDGQVKIRGHRIETAEIEEVLRADPGIRSCAVVARPDERAGTLRLVAYLVARARPVGWDMLRRHLATRLPAAMIPGAQVWLDELPLSANGKLDRAALPLPPTERPETTQPMEDAVGAEEEQVCDAFARALHFDRIGRRDNFFDMGGDSLKVLQVLADLEHRTGWRLSPTLFFRQPTPMAIAAALRSGGAPPGVPFVPRNLSATPEVPVAADAIALIGMAGRFPGAADVEQFWDNLVEGRDTISFFDDVELDAGVSAALRADPAYVRARGVLDGVEDFDAAFFGINAREAALMDPQQRIFLELCWECLERGGYVPDEAPGPVGVYAGMYNASYFQRHVAQRPDLIDAVGAFQVMLGNEKDYIATRAAHILNFRGPAISVHTACSTSLVAVAQAFHALRTGQCRMAVAGGVAVTCPTRSGYLYQEGAMLSPDGRTRSFDADANGTVFSDGAAVVLLKRMSDAVADGDTIYAVLRSACVNNDGSAGASFTAPSVDGQAAVIRAALDAAAVDARRVSYVEAHGTATPMGDPVEIAALTQAFALAANETGHCALGSLKSNVGHMVTAAGAAGLIKTALALHHELLPPTVHYREPNPVIDWARTPFRVVDRLQPWPRTVLPRIAGVSSFGVGGTNAHAIVEEAPTPSASLPDAACQLLTLSARSPAALDRATSQLAAHLQACPEQAFTDVAHTLNGGRKAFAFRRVIVAADASSARDALGDEGSSWRADGHPESRVPQLVFMFPGQGAQYPGMGRGLYAGDPVFRAAFDECTRAFEGVLGFDLRDRMFSDEADALAPTSVTQPAMFALEYALARRLLALGAKPAALIGHSLGEFVAAVLAGVMSIGDAARLVAQRGALTQSLPAGSMLAVRMSADALGGRLGTGVSLAADNAPTACVAAGTFDAIASLQESLRADGFQTRLLQTSHAFHSALMDAAVEPFRAMVAQVSLHAPTLPIFSTTTGRLLTPAEATDPSYWARHLRGPVRFGPAVRSAMAELAHPLFVELGPRSTLSAFVRQQAAGGAGPALAGRAPTVSLLRDDPRDETRACCLGLGRLWTLGVAVARDELDARPGKRRVRLPTYPFERKRHWVDVAAAVDGTATPAPSSASSTPPVHFEPVPHAVPEPPMTLTIAAPSTASTGTDPVALDARLRRLLEDISGIDLSGVAGNVSFGEIGLDSLTLTQVATQIKKHFKVNLSFRQLMERYRSLDALSGFLAAQPSSQMPPTVAPVATAVPAATAVAQLPAAHGEPGHLHLVIAQQLHLLQQQLTLLSGVTPPAAPLAQPVAVKLDDAVATDAPGASYDVKKAFGAIARIHTQRSEPTQRQSVRLAAFVRRYVERTQKSKSFTDTHRAYMADPRVVSGFRPATKEITYQIVIERSRGARLWDIDGNEYIDALNGFGMNMFGWQPDFVQEAVRRQLDAGYEIGPQHPLAPEVCKLVCELTGFDRAGLCNTGSEAVMAALRLARTVTGRNMVVAFAGSYHGTFDEVLVRAGRDAKGIPAAPGVMSGMFGDIRVLDYGTPEAMDFIRAHADELAAVLVEPVQSRRPDFQPREFLVELRDVTQRAGVCLVFDEVITGFRAAPGGAQEIFGVRADLATYGKVIGGGFPIGVIAGRRDFMDALDGGAWQYGDESIPSVGVTYFAGTFVRHPLALAAAQASLEHLKRAGPTLQDALSRRTTALAEELTAHCAAVGAPLAVRHFASLWRVSWLEDHPLQDLFFAMMRSRGIHILDNFPCFLTTAHTEADIDSLKTAFRESLAEMQESGFLPRRMSAVGGFDIHAPPAPGARLVRDASGRPCWRMPASTGVIELNKVETT